uniref:SERPIN domain-containing protein n=1 Tax=Parastrongyloides trichosuri TaxID=131310 RepID=A0A0N4ZM24_PARTI
MSNNIYSPGLEAQAAFTINVFNQIFNSNTSVAFSPYSLTLALAMCYVGAGGKTEEEFKNLLSPKMKRNEFCQYLENSIHNISEPSTNGSNIFIGNKLFVQNNFTLNDTYKKEIKQYFNGDIDNVDFGDAATSAKQINDYISNVTHNKIKDLISSSAITPLTQTILTNAIYFKNSWKEEFLKELTSEDDFYSEPNTTKKVDMMSKFGKMIYGGDSNCHVVKIPYADNRSSFVLVLPREKNTLNEFIKTLTPQKFLVLLHSTSHKKVNLYMPKFKVESTHELNEPLKKIGLIDAFSSNANFSKISSSNHLSIDKVIQKVYVDVNEEGTEAAASTAIMMVMKSAPMMEERPIVVRANHPFLYFILNDEQILFNGVYH